MQIPLRTKYVRLVRQLWQCPHPFYKYHLIATWHQCGMDVHLVIAEKIISIDVICAKDRFHYTIRKSWQSGNDAFLAK